MKETRSEIIGNLLDLDILYAEKIAAPANIKNREALQDWLKTQKSGNDPLPGKVLIKMMPTIKKGFITTGLIIGLISVTLFFIAYYGRPVNLFYLFGIQVALPFALSVNALCAIFRRQNTAKPAIYHRFSPLLLGFVSRFLSNSQKLNSLWRRFTALQIHHQSIYQLFLIHHLQLLGLGTAIGAILGFFLINLFSAPAIGWESTALNESVLAWASKIIAWPWSWLADAIPSNEMIAATRFHSLLLTQKEMNLSQISALYQVWWQFLLFAMLFYRLGSRLLTMLSSSLRLSIESRKAWENLDINRYLNTEYGAFVSANDPSEALSPGLPQIPQQVLPMMPLQTEHSFIWAENTIFQNITKQLNADDAFLMSKLSAVGSDYAADEKALQTLADEKIKKISLISAAAEPPSAAFIDFLQSLQNQPQLESLTLAFFCHEDQSMEKSWAMWRHRLEPLANSKTNFVWFEVAND
jgi:hypothetical protein